MNQTALFTTERYSPRGAIATINEISSNVKSSPRSLRPLRLHQDRALEALRASLAAGHRRPMLQLPTGAGKTRIAAEIIKRALDKGKRVAFTVPAISLIDQTVAAFEAEGIDCLGVMQGIHERTDRDQPVQVCSVQTIARRKRPEVDLVIVDEAHQLHREIFRWMKDADRIPFIGLSATPWARGLGKYYDDLIIAATTADLIRDGYLSAFRRLSRRANRTSRASGPLRAISTRASSPKQWIDLSSPATSSRPGLSAARDGRRSVSASIAVTLSTSPSASSRRALRPSTWTAKPPREDREATFDRFRSGETRVICNVGVLTTGVDLDVRCIVDAKPTKSRILFVQIDRARSARCRGQGQTPNSRPRRQSFASRHGDGHRPGLSRRRERAQSHRAQQSTSVPNLSRSYVKTAEQSSHAQRKPVRVAGPRSTPRLTSKASMANSSSSERAAEASTSPRLQRRRPSIAELRGLAQIKGYVGGWASHKYREQVRRLAQRSASPFSIGRRAVSGYAQFCR